MAGTHLEVTRSEAVQPQLSELYHATDTGIGITAERDRHHLLHGFGELLGGYRVGGIDITIGRRHLEALATIGIAEQVRGVPRHATDVAEHGAPALHTGVQLPQPEPVTGLDPGASAAHSFNGVVINTADAPPTTPP